MLNFSIFCFCNFFFTVRYVWDGSKASDCRSEEIIFPRVMNVREKILIAKGIRLT